MTASSCLAYTEFMKSLTRLVAIMLIAWLPVFGYPATSWACPAMSSTSAVRVQHHYKGTACETRDSKEHTAASGTACHAGLPCAMPFVASLPLTFISLATPSPYASVNRVLISQYAPEPPQRPPKVS